MSFQMPLTVKTLQFGMHHVVLNEFWYSAETFKGKLWTGPFNKMTCFALEVIGFKETFRLIPLLYPLPSRWTGPLKGKNDEILNSNCSGEFLKY